MSSILGTRSVLFGVPAAAVVALMGVASCSGAAGGSGGSGGGSEVGTGTGKATSSGSGGSEPACSSALSSGFSGTVASFAVPPPRCQQDFNAPSGYASTTIDYGLVELSGGGLPDIAVFWDSCDTSIGETHWDLYPGSASGFAASPVSFGVPAARCQQKFSGASSDSNVTIAYSLLDLAGDGHPGIALYRDGCDASVGKTHWDIYPWSSTGFAASPTSFSVPAPRCQQAFNDVYSDSNVTIAYSLLDLTGDGHPDIAVYRDACDASVGQTHWDIYPWSPSGFSTSPVSFGVPAARCQQNFDDASSSSNVTIAYALIDLTGDGHPDIVVYRDTCDASIGETHWDVYPWSSSGFAASPVSFAVPAARCQQDFNDAALDSNVTLAYSLLDLNGAGHPDLAVYRDACDASVGQTHWDIYPWSSSGFAASPVSFGVPAPRCQQRFDDVSSDSNVTIAYDLLKLTSTCKPSLVVTRDACDATVGTSHWDVYHQP